MKMLETYFAVLESPQLMEDKPPERSRRSTRVATFITIPIVIASLAFAQVAAPAEAGVGAVQILVFILLLGLSGLMSASETVGSKPSTRSGVNTERAPTSASSSPNLRSPASGVKSSISCAT